MAERCTRGVQGAIAIYLGGEYEIALDPDDLWGDDASDSLVRLLEAERAISGTRANKH